LYNWNLFIVSLVLIVPYIILSISIIVFNKSFIGHLVVIK
jgi:hypothetical protein